MGEKIVFLKGSFSVTRASVGGVGRLKRLNDVVHRHLAPGCGPSACTHLSSLVEQDEEDDRCCKKEKDGKSLKIIV